MSVTLVVPAYNEEKRIESMFEDYLGTFTDPTFRLYVVINGTSDNTPAIVQKWHEQYPDRVQYCELKQSGKGFAVRVGFQKAIDADLIGFVDADGVTAAKEFEKLFQALDRTNSDGAIASRYLQGARIVERVSGLRRIAGRIYRLIVRVLFLLPYKDTQCGAKVFKQKVIKDILPHLKDNSMAFDVELLSLCKRFKYDVTEVPTLWVEKQQSTYMPSLRHVVVNSGRMLKALISVRIRLWHL